MTTERSVPVLSVSNLSKSYTVKTKLFGNAEMIKAVNQISFEVGEEEILGLIGESGCGKSTTALLLLGLLEPSSGEVKLFNQEITKLSQGKMRPIRKDLQIVFQHTKAVLDPKMSIYELIREPLKIHRIVPDEGMDTEVKRIMGLVGLPQNEGYKFPSQFSGGQNQRVIIARAIATRPRLIICDEPVSALDVSVQGQILNLLMDLKKELKLSYVFISHDLKVIRHMCHRLAVMYKGEIVEIGETWDVLKNPKHAHTKALIEGML